MTYYDIINMRNKRGGNMKKYTAKIIAIIISICLLFTACTEINSAVIESSTTESTTSITIDSNESFDFDSIPSFTDEPYVVINNNIPDFTQSDYTTTSFETYGELDSLGRCTTAYACIGQDLMPTEERGSIGSVKPTGWQTIKYNNVDGKYLYNRCHLIGYQLTAENANERNLITGTRYLNVTGMLPFEDEVAEYIKETGNHVLYRVTPQFEGDELVARGVQMEAYSVEDNGESICFNVYCYNNQPDIEINYSDGTSKAVNSSNDFDDGSDTDTFIVNISSKKFHTKDCTAVEKIKDDNKKTYTGSRQSLINNGYEPCKQCNP
jgi:DNA-entry nuclease